eukprot:CAMPEP_0181047014 /NCGR_PEP_ID=MMETSP1070-20121207/14651_1 /TAXON_ID=265543 /ORGANISM="Minutocellus polymorphus, Strain NH13" /LENGTH=315 /DNA_ID=CAMNT_0023125653 /DNA_START=83 /DNA_END=1027 /DNA_ORIENTATION=-
MIRRGPADLLGTPEFRHLNDGAICYRYIRNLTPNTGGHYFFCKRKGETWVYVTDVRQKWFLTAAATASAGFVGFGSALSAGGADVDAEAAAHALSFLDCVSLARSEAASRAFRHDITPVAWNALANDLSQREKDKARAKIKAETIRPKDVVIQALREKVASEYASQIANMRATDFAAKAWGLRFDGYKSYSTAKDYDDYDVYIRFSDGERVLCSGFFELTEHAIKSSYGNDITSIKMDDADLSEWPEMQSFLERRWPPPDRGPLYNAWTHEPVRPVIYDAFDAAKPKDLAYVVIGLHKRSLVPSVLSLEKVKCRW